MNNLAKKTEKGQSLLEALAVVAVIGIVVLGLVMGLSTSLKNTRLTKEQNSAQSYAQGASEWLIYWKEKNWDAFFEKAGVTGTPLFYCLNELPSDDTAFDSWTDGSCGSTYILALDGTDTIYQREVSLEQKAVKEIEAVTTVSWTSPEVDNEISLTLSLTDWK